MKDKIWEVFNKGSITKTQCLKITMKVAFEIWHFPPIFVLFWLICLVQFQFFKKWKCWMRLFSVIFKHCAIKEVTFVLFKIPWLQFKIWEGSIKRSIANNCHNWFWKCDFWWHFAYCACAIISCFSLAYLGWRWVSCWPSKAHQSSWFSRGGVLLISKTSPKSYFQFNYGKTKKCSV